MKFFIGYTEICGMVTSYAKELKSRGYEVTTCVHAKHKFFPDYDYDIVSNYWADFLLGNDTNKAANKPNNFLNKAALKLRNTTSLFDHLIIKEIYEKHDVFIFIWAGDYLMRDGKGLRILKEMGKKIISIFVGSDARYPEAFQQEFDTDVSAWPLKYKKPFSHYNQVLRNVELYSDLIFSLPDQAGLAIRSYHHFPLPLAMENYKFNWPDRDIPVVVHAPSAPALKGTDIILSTLERLKNEGLQFELKFIQNLNNTELIKLLNESDILVDQTILHGPGVLGIEAMACGCATATHFYEKSPEFFRPPVCAIDNSNIYEQVKKLILDKEYRKKLVFEGRSFVEEHNDIKHIVSNILNTLSKDNVEFDYQPSFFRDRFFLPVKEKITKKDKALNKKTAEKWMPDYALYIQSLKDRNLI